MGIPHIPNGKGAMQKAWIPAPYQKWPKKMPGVLLLPQCVLLMYGLINNLSLSVGKAARQMLNIPSSPCLRCTIRQLHDIV